MYDARSSDKWSHRTHNDESGSNQIVVSFSETKIVVISDDDNDNIVGVCVLIRLPIVSDNFSINTNPSNYVTCLVSIPLNRETIHTRHVRITQTQYDYDREKIDDPTTGGMSSPEMKSSAQVLPQINSIRDVVGQPQLQQSHRKLWNAGDKQRVRRPFRRRIH